tara:strand:- start:1213 stop:1356 length:144 start_codon:yes stop_codon:yes gene_type:complete
MDKNTWINEHVADAKHVDDVQLVDWELYENGSSLGIRTIIFLIIDVN